MVIRGRVVTTVGGVLDAFVPAGVDPALWRRLRPVVTEAVAAAEHTSLHSAHLALRVTTRFCVWADHEGTDLDPEVLLTPARVERFIATQQRMLSSRSLAVYRSTLRRVARAATRTAPWEPDPKAYRGAIPVQPPYTPDEVAGYLAAVDVQATAHRRRVLAALLTLGLGAGLTAGEILACTASLVRRHPTGLTVIVLPDRTVPVRTAHADTLAELCRAYPEGALIGAWTATSKDPLGKLRKNIELSGSLPALSVRRLRTTWMASVLAGDVRISEFLAIAGTATPKTLAALAPYVPGRWDGNEYLHKAAGEPLSGPGAVDS